MDEYRDRSAERALGDEIIRYRARHNLSQTEFANLCGLTKQTIGTIESGRPGRSGNISRITREKVMMVIRDDG